MTSQRSPRLLSLAWLLFFLCAYAWLKLGFGILTCDDAYITLGHARSWLEGLGPVMSPQNPVSATSTPLYTALLALSARVSGTANLEALSFGLNVGWDLAGFFFLHRIAARIAGLSRPFALGLVGAYAMSVLTLSVSAYGMETPMYVALALAGIWFRFGSGSLPGLAAVCFLVPLARPEGILLPAVLIGLGLGKDGRLRTLVCACAAAGGMALFFLFYRHAYGHWLPHSVIAKRLEMRIGLYEGLRSWVVNVFYRGPAVGGRMAVTGVNLAAILFACAGYRRRLPTRADFPWTLLAWPCLYFLFFLATRSSYLWSSWYYLPALPFALLFVFTGWERLAFGRIGSAVAWVFLFLFTAYVPVETFIQKIPIKHRLAHEAREGRYREAARLIDSAASASGTDAPTVMFDEVGALAYFSRAKILDTHGLLSPEALPYLSGPPDDWARMGALRARFAPDWILAARPVEDAGRPHAGERAIYSGYSLARDLRRPSHPLVVEMWRRDPGR